MSLLFSLFLALFIGTTSAEEPAGYQIGDIATDFELLGTDGNTHSLSGMEDAKGYVVIFTCNHCPYSIAYEDRIIALNTEFATQGYPVVAINPNDPAVQPKDSYEAMKVRAKDKGFNFPYLFDEGQKIYPQYGATKTPHVYILDADRKVMYIGAIDDSTDEGEVTKHFAADAIKALMAGKSPEPSLTKAVGCSIKAAKK